MPEYLAPGVYIEEIERGPPDRGGGDQHRRLPRRDRAGPDEPRLVTSYSEYLRYFGGIFAEGKYMPYAVSGFFDNGGRRAYICRIIGANAAAATRTVGGLTIDAIGPGAWGDRVFVKHRRQHDDDRPEQGPGRLPAAGRLLADARRPDGQYPDPFDPHAAAAPAAADA